MRGAPPERANRPLAARIPRRMARRPVSPPSRTAADHNPRPNARAPSGAPARTSDLPPFGLAAAAGRQDWEAARATSNPPPDRPAAELASEHAAEKAAALGSAAWLIPPGASLGELSRAAAGCQACPLWARATQTVFGEGDPRAAVMLVGEQPGDGEDRQGHPFVGPAGGLLYRALAEAGLDRASVYVTNAVKHFNWEPRGEKRIHKKPTRAEMAACRPWLQAEILTLRPRVIVALGATAAQSLLGHDARVLKMRGHLHPSPWGPPVLTTVHPAALLRAPDPEMRRRETRVFVADLRRAAAAAARAAA